MERLKGRAQLQARLNAMLVSSATLIPIGMMESNAVAQCAGYSVEVFAGPNCQFLPSFAHATGIADNGAICGGYTDCAEVFHPLIWWPNGDVTELPHSADGGDPQYPFELNSAGEVAGRMDLPGQPSPIHQAFVYSNGVTLDLGMLPGQNTAEAVAINSSSVVVGTSNNTGFGPLTAFIWQNGKLLPLRLS